MIPLWVKVVAALGCFSWSVLCTLALAEGRRNRKRVEDLNRITYEASQHVYASLEDAREALRRSGTTTAGFCATMRRHDPGMVREPVKAVGYREPARPDPRDEAWEMLRDSEAELAEAERALLLATEPAAVAEAELRAHQAVAKVAYTRRLVPAIREAMENGWVPEGWPHAAGGDDALTATRITRLFERF